MKITKPVFIWNTPRSGSSALGRMIYIDNPGMYTNLLQCYFSRDRTAEIIDSQLKITFWNDEAPEEMKIELTLYKLGLLKQLEPNYYLMKGNAGHRYMVPELWEYLTEHYHFLCLRRRDTLNQFLSDGLAKATGTWHNLTDPNNSKYPDKYRIQQYQSGVYDGLFNYSKKDFDNFSYLIKDHNRDCALLSPEQKTDIYYEDIQEELEARGEDLGLFRIPYPKSKIDLFKNKEEILQWYENWQWHNELF